MTFSLVLTDDKTSGTQISWLDHQPLVAGSFHGRIQVLCHEPIGKNVFGVVPENRYLEAAVIQRDRWGGQCVMNWGGISAGFRTELIMFLVTWQGFDRYVPWRNSGSSCCSVCSSSQPCVPAGQRQTTHAARVSTTQYILDRRTVSSRVPPNTIAPANAGSTRGRVGSHPTAGY